ncbi:hypothetical protein BGX38DRAFT_1245479 [Terfezia claveryi]|nr:hypothetical protein BGX38DRAFT_1245479 [Terfezia claveryi]
MPTARSPGMLLHMLGIYPILESILSTGHRCESSTSPEHVVFFTSRLPPLLAGYKNHSPVVPRTCSPVFSAIHLCASTAERTQWNKSYPVRWGRYLQGCRNHVMCTHVHLCQHIRHNYFCEVCFYKPRATMGKSISHNKPEWYWESRVREETGLNNAVSGIRFLRIPYLVWDDVPNGDSTCICAMFETGCQISPHIVRVENLPIESEWAGLVVETTTEFRSKMFGLSGTSHLNSYGLFRIPFYVMD